MGVGRLCLVGGDEGVGDAAVGAGESFAFVEQTRLYADAWRRWGGRAEHLVVPGVHHFDVLLELTRAGSPLSRSLYALMGL